MALTTWCSTSWKKLNAVANIAAAKPIRPSASPAVTRVLEAPQRANRRRAQRAASRPQKSGGGMLLVIIIAVLLAAVGAAVWYFDSALILSKNLFKIPPWFFAVSVRKCFF